jgi:hypothetical protein
MLLERVTHVTYVTYIYIYIYIYYDIVVAMCYRLLVMGEKTFISSFIRIFSIVIHCNRRKAFIVIGIKAF